MTTDDGAGGLGLPGREERAEGAFLALAAGDALGWPQESPRRVRAPRPLPRPGVGFTGWTRRGGTRFQPYDEVIGPGEYSDDTQLALAIARSRVKHGEFWWDALTRTELPFWTLYERGGGAATRRAARAWAAGRPPWESERRGEADRYFRAGGNGVAMRVLPHAVFRAAASGEQVVGDALRDGTATHGHPRALVGAAAYAGAAWYLLRKRDTLALGELVEALLDSVSFWAGCPGSGEAGTSWTKAAVEAVPDYEESWKRVVGEMRRLLEVARAGVREGAMADDRAVMESLGCFGPEKGSGTISTAAAVYLASRHAVAPRRGVLRAAFAQPADTDTLGAMVGGLLGCVAGADWLPGEWRSVQDAGYLRRLAVRLAGGPEGAEEAPVGPAPRAEAVFRALADNGGGELEIGKTLRGHATAWDGVRPASRSLRAESWRFVTVEGQTMYLHRLERVEPAPASRRGERGTSDRSGGRGAAGRLPLAISGGVVPTPGASRRMAPTVVPEAAASFVAVRGLATRLAHRVRRRRLDLADLQRIPEGGATSLSSNGERLAQVPTEDCDAVLRHASQLLETGHLPPLEIELRPVSVSLDTSRILVKGEGLRPTSVGLLVERRSDGLRHFAVERDATKSVPCLELRLPASLRFETEDDAVSVLTTLCSRMLGSAE